MAAPLSSCTCIFYLIYRPLACIIMILHFSLLSPLISSSCCVVLLDDSFFHYYHSSLLSSLLCLLSPVSQYLSPLSWKETRPACWKMNDAQKEKDSFKKRQEDAKKKQSGELPPDLDQDGKMINPHNPDFITKVPWYLGDSGPTLKHHNVQKVDHFLSLSESDQLIQSKLQTKQKNQQNKSLVFRKGACKNCGAMTHKEKDCVERPRSSKKAAWKSGTDIAADEVILKMEEHGKIAYDAKRDQWQGYNPEEHKKTVERYDRMEKERKKFAREAREAKRLAAEEARKAKQEKKRGLCFC